MDSTRLARLILSVCVIALGFDLPFWFSFFDDNV
jgi:hypothetical protein